MTKTIVCAALALALALALGTGGALAQDKAEPKQVKKIVIMHEDGTTRDIDVERARAIAKDCGGEKLFENSGETEVDGKKQRTKIVLCGEGDRLAALEKARARLAGSENLGFDPRTKALAALDREIARLKGE